MSRTQSLVLPNLSVRRRFATTSLLFASVLFSSAWLSILAPVSLADDWAAPMAGVYVEPRVGLSVVSGPWSAGPSFGGSAGIWWGRYDSVYAIGRFSSLGATVRYELTDPDRLVAMLEARRGIDLIAGLFGFVAAGPELGESTSWTVRAGVGARYRFTRFSGVSARLEAGGGFGGGGPVGSRLGLSLGGSWSRPFRKLSD